MAMAGGSAFLSPHYALAVDQSRGCVFACYLQHPGGEAAGFLPFQFRSAWHRKLGCAERVGGDLTDGFGIASRRDGRYDTDQLLRSAGLQALHFTHLHENQQELGLTGESPRKGLRIRGVDSYWEELATRRRNSVRELERVEGKLEREIGRLQFVWHNPDSRELERLIEGKGAQYRRTGRANVLAAPWKRDLMNRLHASREGTCAGVLSTLYAGEQWVSSHFGLRCGEVLHYWFPVYNPALRRYSPGRLLKKRILLNAKQEGVNVIDQGEGDTPAKRFFANEEYLLYRGLWVRRGLLGVAARMHFALEWRLDRLTVRLE